MITAETKMVGLIGYPVGHSLSPIIQNAAFRASGLNWAYVALPVQTEDLEVAVKGLKAIGFVGVNVTIPHKVMVTNFLDDIDVSAKMAGAVNTLLFQQGRILGYNTDMIGFVRSFKRNKVEIAGKQAVVLGAGGAARAAVAGLLSEGIRDVWVSARSKDKAIELCQAFHTFGNLHSCCINELDDVLPNTDLIVQATSVGMWPKTDFSVQLNWKVVPIHAVVCDLIYTPLVTQFLQHALDHELKIITGDTMLIEQGAEAFKLWTDSEPDIQAMKKAFYDK